MNALERMLRAAGRELPDYQIARFWKIPEEMQQTPCDFMGFTASGRVIMIEAKQVTRSSLPIAMSPGLLPHQYGALDECNRAGGLALLCWAQRGICATLSFDQVERYSRGRKSIPWDTIPDRYMRSMRKRAAHLALLEHWLPLEEYDRCRSGW